MNKKIILGIIGILILAILISVIVLILNRNDEIDEPIENGQTEDIENGQIEDIGNTAVEGMEPLNKIINLTDVLKNVKDIAINGLKVISDIEANELIHLDEYEGLEKRVAMHESEDEYTEIWLLKISEDEQASKIFRKFDKRIEDLRMQYSDNQKISEMLKNEKNISMKLQGKIAIVIISNDVENVEKAVDEEILK